MSSNEQRHIRKDFPKSPLPARRGGATRLGELLLEPRRVILECTDVEAIAFAILTGLIVVVVVRVLVLLSACGQERSHELHDGGHARSSRSPRRTDLAWADRRGDMLRSPR